MDEKLRPSDGWLVLLGAFFLYCHVIAIGDGWEKYNQEGWPDRLL